MQWQPLALLYLPAFASSVWAAVVMLRRRRTSPAAGALAVVLVGVAWWSAATSIGSLSSSHTVQLALSVAIFPGVCAVVAGFFCHALAMVDAHWRLSRRMLVLLLVEPVLVVVASAGNGAHHLFYRGSELVGHPALLVLRPGPLFWAHTVYSYGLLVCTVLLVVRAWVHAPGAYRKQFVWPLIAALPPVAGNLAGMFVLTDGQTTDLAPIFFAGTAALCWWALNHRVLPELVPVAHQQVLATVPDAVAVLNADRRVVDLNPAADALIRRLLPDLTGALRGLFLTELLPGLVLAAGRDQAQTHLDVRGSGLDLDLRISTLTDRRGGDLGWVLVAREVTTQNRQRRRLEEANARLAGQVRTIERLRADLAEQAVRDALTGLHNRRHLTDTLAALPPGAGFGVIMLDVDHFKSVNDRYGHRTGDQVLQAVGAVLRTAVHPGAVLARYGGEEFVVLLPGAGLTETAETAEQIRGRCAAAVLPAGDGTLSVTVSAGVATGHGGAATAGLDAADQALYRAKREGRNRVVVTARSGTPVPLG